MNKIKKTATLLMCFLLVGCSPKEKKSFQASTLTAGFDTVITLQLYADSQEAFNEEFQKVENLFYYYHTLFDKYHLYEKNNIKTINDAAGKQPVQVDQELIDLLLIAKKYSELSNHQFDVTLGPVLELWHDVREKAENQEPYALPSSFELQKASLCTGWDKVDIDDDNNTVYLNTPCASLDVGAIAKGYATQKVKDMLIQDGYTNGFINAGGNVQILGSKINGDPWKTGIQSPDPTKQGHSILQFELKDATAFVTSGDYQRYFIHNDQIIHHIIDPDTLYPARHAKSVTILCEDGTIADILSTTLYTMTYQEGKDFINQLNMEIQVIWIYDKTDEIENENYIEKEGFYILSTKDLQ